MTDLAPDVCCLFLSSAELSWCCWVTMSLCNNDDHNDDHSLLRTLDTGAPVSWDWRTMIRILVTTMIMGQIMVSASSLDLWTWTCFYFSTSDYLKGVWLQSLIKYTKSKDHLKSWRSSIKTLSKCQHEDVMHGLIIFYFILQIRARLCTRRLPSQLKKVQRRRNGKLWHI